MELHEFIDENAPHSKEKPRRYIGASSLSDCSAAIGFQMRGFPSNPPKPRVQRIFNLGHAIEELVVKDMQASGITVLEVDPHTGKQWRYTDFGGHIKCHLDGLCRMPGGELHVLEIKSMQQKYFNQFVKHGAAKSHPQYVRQVHMCMELSGVKRAVIVALNKNDSTYHSEVIEFDPLVMADIKSRVEDALLGVSPRIRKRPGSYPCSMCPKSQVCWQEAGWREGDGLISDIPRNCATCMKSLPKSNGLWECLARREEVGPEEFCSSHQLWEPNGDLE